MRNSKNKPVVASPEELKLFEQHYSSAIFHNDIKPLRDFVTSHPQFIDVIPNRPLWAAVRCNDLDFVTWLIDQGAETDVFCKGSNWNEDRPTPLHLAVMNNQLDLVVALLEAGASPHLTNGVRHSETALSLFIRTRFAGKNIAIIQELIKAGADPNSIDGQGTPLLVKLMKWGFEFKPVELLKAVKILIKAGADPNLSDSEGLNPLHVCAQKGYAKIAEYLIQNGANPELKDAKGHDFKWHAEHGTRLSWDLNAPHVKRVISRMNARNSYQISKEGYFVAPEDKESKTESPTVKSESGKKDDYQWLENLISSDFAKHVKNRAAVLPIWEKRNELKLDRMDFVRIDDKALYQKALYQVKDDYYLPGDLSEDKESKTELPKPKKQKYTWATLFPVPKHVKPVTPAEKESKSHEGVKPFFRDKSDAEEDDEMPGLDLVLN
jgi:ankyrin repeat protein